MPPCKGGAVPIEPRPQSLDERTRTSDFLIPNQAGWPLPYIQMAPGAGVEPAHGSLNRRVPCRLAIPEQMAKAGIEPAQTAYETVALPTKLHRQRACCEN